ncbi:MAG TPA: hypothetical protein ENG56_01210 [Candidatus Aenigmarchaeota archaeon]|nr:hypothetical protein [Candidatus Aenigmarchaeota archaeon]
MLKKSVLLDSLWKHKVLLTFGASFIIAIQLVSNEIFRNWILHLFELSPFIGSFLSGAFYATFITVPIGTVMLFLLARSINPFFVIFVGALGACLTNLLFFEFFQISIIPEIKLLGKELGQRNPRIFKLWKSLKIAEKLKEPLFVQKVAPLISALIILSPIPDEIGIFLLSASKYEIKKFVPCSFILNTIGISLIVFLGNLLA